MTTQRWTDEMLDSLANSVVQVSQNMTVMQQGMIEMRESITEMRESITEMREGMTEMRESINTLNDSVDGLRVTSQALLQVAAQHQRDMELVKEEIELMKQRQAENDQRFYVLLDEIRYLNRRNNPEEGNSN